VIARGAGGYDVLGAAAEALTERGESSGVSCSYGSVVIAPDRLTLEEALQLLSLPRVVGTDAEEREILPSPGRFGPYLKRADGDTRSLASEEQLFTITLAQAEALFAQPKQRRGRQQKPPLAELGEHPDSKVPVRVLDGRYGPYVTDGTTNASVPRGADPAGSRSTKRRPVARPRGRPAKKAKKTAKKATKKPAKAAKATAKKTAKKPAKKSATPQD
jgi:DNA topoisomerase-1